MSNKELEQTLLEHLGLSYYRPVKPGKIAKALGFNDAQARELKKLVKRLVIAGKVAYGPKHTIGLAEKIRSNQIIGTFRRTSGGFGFVRPKGVTSRDAGEDIYIPANRTGDAANGDVVAVELSKPQKGNRRGGPNKQGSIAEVVERETHRFVGSYSETAGDGYVTIDGGVFTHPVLVGDASAKSANTDDKVVIEMVRFPSHVHHGEGVIVDILGQRGDPGVDTQSIIHEFNLPGEFPEDVIEDARAQGEAFDESIPADRTDLTEETIITIDPFDARDFDDAISLEMIETKGRNRQPHWRLGVHIADVSHFVREKSPLDREARNRATSVYLPDLVIPMIPETISNNLASLQPDRVRYTKTVFLEFTPDGTRVSIEAHSAAIQSKRRFTYEEVDEYLEDPDPWKKKLTPQVHSLLGRMRDLARVLRRRRFARGSLELSMRDVKIDLDKDGRVEGAHLEENTESHKIIEEFMLAANEAVADMFAEKDLPFIRRVHGAPEPRKLKMLTEFVNELGFKTNSLESRFELQELLDRVKEKPEEHAINYAMLRSMQKAVYGPEDEGHFALASECYCHFTSPIRRYPDLTIHRLLDRILKNENPAVHYGELAALGEHCSDREQRATQAERELNKVKLLAYLSDRIGEEMEAVITGVQEFGIFAQGIDLPAEGLVHVTSLQDDYYHYDRRSHSLSGFRNGQSYQLGDFIRIAVVRVDVDNRELDFRIVGRSSGPGDEGNQRRRGRPDRRQAAGRRGGKATGGRGNQSRGGDRSQEDQDSRRSSSGSNRSGKGGGQRSTKKKSTRGSSSGSRKKKTTGGGKPGTKKTTAKKTGGKKKTSTSKGQGKPSRPSGKPPGKKKPNKKKSRKKPKGRGR